MIYVVELPHQGRPHAWFAFNRDDFVRKVQATHGSNQASEDFDASVAVLERALKACRIYMHDELAIRALQSDPLLDPKEGFYAHMALREQLIAMDAMEEDI
jgi:hypothetical protein